MTTPDNLKNGIIIPAGVRSTEQPPVETSTVTNNEPSVKPFEGSELVLQKPDGRTLKLVKQETARAAAKGEARWTYPGLPEDTFTAETVIQLQAYFGDKEFTKILFSSFDRLFQQTWRNCKSDVGRFTTVLTDETIQRMPKSMAAHYMKLSKEKKAEANKATTPEEKSKLMAEFKDLFVKYLTAAKDEAGIEDSDLELVTLEY